MLMKRLSVATICQKVQQVICACCSSQIELPSDSLKHFLQGGIGTQRLALACPLWAQASFGSFQVLQDLSYAHGFGLPCSRLSTARHRQIMLLMQLFSARTSMLICVVHQLISARTLILICGVYQACCNELHALVAISFGG